MTRYVRKALGRGIIKKYLSHEEELIVATLDRTLEDLIISGVENQDDGSSTLNLEPETAKNLLNNIAESMSDFNKFGTIPILLTGAQIRWDLKKLIERFIPGIIVLAYDEVPSDISTKNILTITS